MSPLCAPAEPSSLSILSITDNSIDPARRMRQTGCVLHGFHQARLALGEHSPDDSPFLIVELDFQELVSGPQQSRRAVGKHVAVIAPLKPVRACQNSVFLRQKSPSALTCSDQRKATVQSSTRASPCSDRPARSNNGAVAMLHLRSIAMASLAAKPVAVSRPCGGISSKKMRRSPTREQIATTWT